MLECTQFSPSLLIGLGAVMGIMGGGAIWAATRFGNLVSEEQGYQIGMSRLMNHIRRKPTQAK